METILSPIQSAPGATTLTDVYTVPADTQTVISTAVVCNRGTATSFRIAISPDGAAIANAHYLFYDTAIQANETLTFTLGFTMDETDILRVYGTSANLSFNFFAVENT